MKKTIRINISGSIFTIDEDAYLRLQKYLEDISTRFSSTEEGEKIVEDVESRIAELFKERVTNEKQVITLSNIEEIIIILGEPEVFYYQGEYDPSEENGNTSKEHKSTRGKRGKRKLYRDTGNKILGGVCSGLAHYYGFRPNIVRLVFVLLFFMFKTAGILTYILLWIIVPESKTSAQRLEMKGERINLDNIEKTVKDNFAHVKDSFNKFPDSKGLYSIKIFFDRFFNIFPKTLYGFFRVLFAIIGLALIIGGFAATFSLMASILFTETIFSHTPWGQEFPMSGFITLFSDTGSVLLIKLGIFLAVVIPMMAIMYLGIKLLVRFQSKNKLVGFIGFILCIIGVVILGSSVGKISKNFKTKGEYSSDITIDSKSNILYLDVNQQNSPYIAHYDSFVDIDNMSAAYFNGNTKIFGKPRLNIIPGTSESVEIEISYYAKGKNRKSAVRNAKKINYQWKQQNDSVLMFDSYFALPDNDKWRKQRMEIVLKVPVGQKIYLKNNMLDIIYDIYNIQNMWDREMINKSWIMKPEGLSLVVADNSTQEDIQTDSLNLTETDITTLDDELDEALKEMND